MIDLKNNLLKKTKQYFSKNSRAVIPSLIICAFLLIGVAVAAKKNVTISIDGKVKKVATYKDTVREVLSSSGINPDEKDKVLPGLDNKVEDDMVISIKKAFPVAIDVDGKVLNINTAENTVKDVLSNEGIILNERDKVIPSLDAALKSGSEIKIVRVIEKTIRVQEKIAYNTLRRTDVKLEKGATKTIQDGVDGEKEIAYKAVYENGIEVAREKIGEAIKKAPVDKIVSVGTLAWFTPSRGSERVYYVKKFRMKATSYTADYASTGKRPGDKGFGITATGTRARRVPFGYSTVAVDPKVIPLGTRLYVEGYGFAIAEDTGGAVKGNVIDLYFSPGTQELRSWSTRRLNVYVVK